jgi:predicted metal-dependent hydrolase/CheY-like chemotaxis protein
LTKETASGATDYAQPIVANGAELISITHLEDVIRRQGGQAIIVETPQALVDAVDAHFPVLVLVDLNLPGDWEGAIRRCKLRPHTKQIPIYAYGSHVDTAMLAAARAAGADHSWARSKMMKELAAVVHRHLHPPTRYADGWDGPLHPEAVMGVEEFNAGHYFEQHEHFETAWMAEPRPIRDLYQGILQVGLAFLQIEQGNWAGALKMFRRGLPRLRDLPPVSQGIDVASLTAAAEAIHREVTELGPARLAEFDRSKFPQIQRDLFR